MLNDATGPRLLPRPEWSRRLLLRWLMVPVAMLAVVVVAGRLQAPPLLAAGAQAPRFQLATADGGTLDPLAAAAGRPVVLEFFWADCPACIDAEPSVCRFATAHPGVEVVGVDAHDDSAAAIRGFRSAHMQACPAPAYPLLVDPGHQTALRYGVSQLPTLYVIDPSGRVAAAGTGQDEVGRLAQQVAAIQPHA